MKNKNLQTEKLKKEVAQYLGYMFNNVYYKQMRANNALKVIELLHEFQGSRCELGISYHVARTYLVEGSAAAKREQKRLKDLYSGN